MSAIQVTLATGNVYYTKDYETIKEVRQAIDRGESLNVFWFTHWGRKYNEELLVNSESVAYLMTEHEIV